MSGILVLCALIAIAVLFGLFFLFFKIIWILCKSKRNFWPLVLAGVVTLGISLAAFLSVRSVYKHYVIPFSPIMERIGSQTAPVHGQHIYTDPRYGFSIMIYDGMTFSNWIDVEEVNFLAGIDTNIFLEKKQNIDDLSAVLLLRQVQDQPVSAHQIMSQLMPQLRHASFPQGEIETTEEPSFITTGPEATASYVPLIIYSADESQQLSAALLITARGNEVYYIIGFGEKKIPETLKSFQFPAL